MSPSLWHTDKASISALVRPLFAGAGNAADYLKVMRVELALLGRAYDRRAKGRRMFRLLPQTPPVIYLGEAERSMAA